MNKTYSARDMFFIAVSFIFIVLFWVPFFEHMGGKASLFELFKIFIKMMNQLQKTNFKGASKKEIVFFSLSLLTMCSVLVFSIISFITAIMHKTEASRSYLITVMLCLLLWWFFGSYETGYTFSKMISVMFKNFFKYGYLANYAYFFVGITAVAMHNYLPDTPLGEASSAVPPPPPLPPGSVACPACHAVQAQDSRFCKSCGRPLAQPCPQCQALVGPDARFCPKCGRSTAPTCPKCNKPIDPSSRFCKHCGAPTAAQDASTAAPSTQAKRKEVFVGAMQFVQDPNEEGFAFCSECGKKEEKRNLYHNDEINQYVHRDCLMSLQENPETPDGAES